MSGDCPTVAGVPVGDTRTQDDVAKLDAAFLQEYGHPPAFYVRAPGRVNLIGEHIDYCGYAVLPMAIDQCILMAVAEDAEPKLTIVNTDPRYKKFVGSLADIAIDKSKPKWYNYVLAGYLGVQTHQKLAAAKGMKLAVTGSIPPSSGLSSSSALVCAAALATSHLNSCHLTKMDLANLCAKCERYVGTEGGGMDQAICFFGTPGTAKLIEFNPLKVYDVHLPNKCVFVIGNSLSDINKAATSQYNTRVVECRLACKVLSKKLGHDWKNVPLLSDLQRREGVTSEAMAEKVREHLHTEPYSRKEVCDLLGITDQELVENYLSQNTSHLEEFKLHQRALHVYSEYQRVRDFREICSARGGRPDAADLLGSLMNQSHASCRDDYECSHPDLDELVQVSLAAGALGSRLTGAGWGGCTVSLVLEDKVDDFLTKVTEGFYHKHPVRKERVATSLFCSHPANGTMIFKTSI